MWNGIATPMHADRRKVISWSLRLSAAGDWERYAAQAVGWDSSLKIVCWCLLWLVKPYNKNYCGIVIKITEILIHMMNGKRFDLKPRKSFPP